MICPLYSSTVYGTVVYFCDLQFITKYLIQSFHSCYVQGGRLLQVTITKKDNHRTATGWLRPLNRGGRLMQVTNTAFVSLISLKEQTRTCPGQENSESYLSQGQAGIQGFFKPCLPSKKMSFFF